MHLIIIAVTLTVAILSPAPVYYFPSEKCFTFENWITVMGYSFEINSLTLKKDSCKLQYVLTQNT